MILVKNIPLVDTVKKKGQELGTQWWHDDTESYKNHHTLYKSLEFIMSVVSTWAISQPLQGSTRKVYSWDISCWNGESDKPLQV